ncbi:LysR substrate-binding domain-containing protein [Streptomyces sp. NPDC052773]|uniref:LysR substrate-binding domain-containing protein n=1 Tax=Streptomyces sp. NPDC052773 TaxID=3365693 RepID=UPI0037D3912C
MDLRDIQIFLTLAEELHFGRTAERLRLTPARVSQSIKKQERRIGAPLFHRTTRTVRLTPLGEQLQRRLSEGYEQIVAGIDAVTAAARGISGSLALGTMGAMARAIGDVLDLFRSRYPDVELRFREIHPPDPLTPLRSGEVDVGVLWLPVREPDLTVGPVLRASPIMVMAAPAHPLAAQDAVTLEDLGDHAVLGPAGPIPEYMEAGLIPFHTSSGRPIRRAGRVNTFQEVLTTIADGHAVALTQAEAADYYPWPDIRYLPIRDAPPSRWALVWKSAAETPLIRAFAEAAADARSST